MNWLYRNPELWDAVFREPADRLAFVDRQLRDVRGPVLDVGCATGNLCLHLRDRGTSVVGVDVNPTFIRAARAKDPAGQYREGDMRTLRLRRKFGAILCMGTTLALIFPRLRGRSDYAAIAAILDFNSNSIGLA